MILQTPSSQIIRNSNSIISVLKELEKNVSILFRQKSLAVENGEIIYFMKKVILYHIDQ